MHTFLAPLRHGNLCAPVKWPEQRRKSHHGRFDTTPPDAALPRADEHAAQHIGKAAPPEFPGVPDGIPTVPAEGFAGRLPEDMQDEAADHLPDFLSLL
ncbi:hypothetical protein EF888_12065 [Silicimonas algicola]|uniref:Uncharacterized protein n=1 Tax=Silicimonas algicola TaxID=1826607 RepID=A0A316GCQ5_9RHOB|nr:hypothetical protein [Silicimonas algicola]AZQ67806.1 hypothetical protein EF888_12065 [Silicimonas algicola]PWK57776.1 hypothetical protein C8D95_102424 [Silicimonas algicola]